MGNTRKIGGIHYEIMARCYNPKRIMYPKYGGRGIKVCEEWHDRDKFREWALANGFNGTQRLERIDSGGDYCPENCRFGTKYKKKESEQKENRHKKEVCTGDVVNGCEANLAIKCSEDKKQKKTKRKSINSNRKVVIKYGLKTADNPLYSIYNGMHTRCDNPNDNNYDSYGAKGITVCQAWSGENGLYNFTVWAMQNGWSKGLSIDRIDNNRGCRKFWI